MRKQVLVWEDRLLLPTYEPQAPDKNPMFLEKRVYQGSRGKVYPLPFTDRIAEEPVGREWKAVWIENEFLRALVLPEIGGRIHAIQDKTNGYDLIYNQHVIKPALVGLAGPWISGGIEFNWPQHHRPATFMPVDVEIENHADGSVTVWCGDHDPMARMKGMHGVCLHPGKAFLEVKVRAYNRTPFVQTFLWWANVATRVHEAYQSFFPPDVHYVADHARRSMSEYPLCEGSYYGVDYQTRAKKGVPPGEYPRAFIPPACRSDQSKIKIQQSKINYSANDLSFYANIPVPTSYMCMGSKEDFFGGYDHAAQAGVVHIANHHISPGKKQWTWGNHEFGYAWDRNLTDAGGPYIEIMAGVYTDNQPDFSFLMPGETKSWSQFWYPIQKIGPAQHANLDAAVSLRVERGKARIGVSVSSIFRGARISLGSARASRAVSGASPEISAHTGKAALSKMSGVSSAGTEPFARAQATERENAFSPFFQCRADLAPGNPFVKEIKLSPGTAATDLLLRVLDADGREIIACAPQPRVKGEEPPPATEPPLPADIASADELYLAGLHLEQYRHATRRPESYWNEALRRDPGDARCNNALGRRHFLSGEFTRAEMHFRKAIERLTSRNGNPADGEPFYNLGLALRYLRRDDEAYAAFYKATWNQAWQSAGYHQLAELDCRKQDWASALDHIDRSLRLDTDNLRARNLRAIVLRRLGLDEEADDALSATRKLDPLDWWSRHLSGEPVNCDTQTRLDIALDFAGGGFFREAVRVLEGVKPDAGTAPLIGYYTSWFYAQFGEAKKAAISCKAAAKASPDYCFPSRLEEIPILEAAIRVNPADARAPYYLGNLFYDRKRHAEAIRLWEQSARLDASFPVVWRNLGIGYFNILKNTAKARSAYDRAFRAAPSDARLLYERDQLWKRLGESPAKRLRELEKHPDLVRQRDDLSVEFCGLYNQTGQHAKALQILSKRKFQPWEGGEGQALGQHVRTRLALGREALAHHDYPGAAAHFENALISPGNLGEARHLLANQSDIHYWLGVALEQLRDKAGAKRHWTISAEFRGDFQEMSVRAFSEMTYYSALSLERLGKKAAAKKLLRDLFANAQRLEKTEAKIDYFATSLPAMLLFYDDIQFRQQTTALFLQAQALLGLGKKAKAVRLLKTVLQRDPNHALASDLAGEIQTD